MHCTSIGNNHSSDTHEIHHGYASPAIACGYHATHFKREVFEAHREEMNAR